jgi:ABC-type siderophore export system fused ATPase/permease subunit
MTIVAISHQAAIRAVADQVLEVGGGQVREVRRPALAAAAESELDG